MIRKGRDPPPRTIENYRDHMEWLFGGGLARHSVRQTRPAAEAYR